MTRTCQTRTCQTPLGRSVVVVAVMLLAGACATEKPVPIGVQEIAADVVYADGSIDPPPAPPPAADPGTGSPGFLAPPAPPPPLPHPPPPGSSSTTTAPTTTTTTVPVTDCPADDLTGVPEESPQTIGSAPAVGSYPYRQEGTVEIDDAPSPVQAEVEHRVQNVEELPTGNLRFEVAITEGELVTTSTYDIRRGGVSDGLYLTQSQTEDSVSLGAFTPSFSILVLPAPAVKGAQWSSSGVDPLTGVSMTIHGQVIDKERVNACGTPLDAWVVQVGPESNTGAPSRISGPGKDMAITGTYAVSTHLGGLIVRDSLRFEGIDGGQNVVLDRTAIINQIVPDPLPAS